MSLLIVAVAVAVTGCGALLPTGSNPVHLGSGVVPPAPPAASTGGPCSAATYPVGAEYRFERCTTAGAPVGWACGKVTYSVDPASAPAGYAADLDRALTQLQQATGLRLVRVTGSADIPISWDPTLYDPLPGTSGEAGVTDIRIVGDQSGLHLTMAMVRISSHLAGGAAPRVGEEPVLLHELGHAVGLGHYQGAVVMNPLDKGFGTYQPGDLAGLAVLYRPGSCGH